MKSFLKKIRGLPTLISFHINADLDAVGSAIALRRYLKNAKIVAPDRIISSSQKLADYCKETIYLPSEVNLKSFSHFILLDSNSASLAVLSDQVKFDCIIDHHSLRQDSIFAKHSLIDNSASSTCELVFGLIGASDKISSLALLCGLISDSAYFRNATAKTFDVAHALMKNAKMPYLQVLSFVDHPPDVAHRLSVLESCRNVEIIHKQVCNQDLIVVVSQTSAFESDSAWALIELGADVAIVGHAGKLSGRISSRMRNSLSDKLDMSKVMFEVAPLIGGTGGGHPCAAGAHGTKPQGMEYALNKAVRLIFEMLESSCKTRYLRKTAQITNNKPLK